MDQSIAAPKSDRVCWTTGDIQQKIESSNIVVFAKGTEDNPSCGFSERVVSILAQSGRRFEVVNVKDDPSIQPALRSFSGHRELPLVYANGQLVACCNSLQHLIDAGELEQKVSTALSS